jgi:hypothetical protein
MTIMLLIDLPCCSRKAVERTKTWDLILNSDDHQNSSSRARTNLNKMQVQDYASCEPLSLSCEPLFLRCAGLGNNHDIVNPNNSCASQQQSVAMHLINNQRNSFTEIYRVSFPSYLIDLSILSNLFIIILVELSIQLAVQHHAHNLIIRNLKR